MNEHTPGARFWRWSAARLATALLVLVPGFPATSGSAADEPPLPGPPRPDPGAAIRFVLGNVAGRRGEEVDLPLRVRSSVPLSMVTWTVEYDPGILEFIGPRVTPQVNRTLARVFGGKSRFQWFSNPDEGWLQASMILDFDAREKFSLPPGIVNALASLTFRVQPDAPAGRHSLVFTRTEDAPFSGNFHDGSRPVFNVARGHGRPFTEEDLFGEVMEPELEDGTIVLPIIGDVGIFVRGDVNLDLDVNIVDPVLILDFLFNEGATPECPTAADANRDSTLNISDPITILVYLFVGSSNWYPSTEKKNAATGCSL